MATMSLFGVERERVPGIEEEISIKELALRIKTLSGSQDGCASHTVLPDGQLRCRLDSSRANAHRSRTSRGDPGPLLRQTMRLMRPRLRATS